jgi:16S rRNA processing protein RimM
VGTSVKQEQVPEGAKEKTAGFITLARVVKTQGRHGEVAAEVHSDIPDRFATGMKLSALGKDNSRRELRIEELWPHKEFLVFKFEGIASISDAELLIGAELQIPSAERAELERGWNYVSDLIGCTLFDHGREVGAVEDVQFGAGEAPLLVVKGKDGGAFDVPFAEEFLEGADIVQKQVRMNLPEGMLEVNAPLTAEEKKRQAGGRKKR